MMCGRLWIHAIVFAAGLGTSCAKDSAEAPARGCDICDPTRHEVFPYGCATSVDCPTGTRCLSYDGESTEPAPGTRMLGGCDAARPDQTRRCQLPSGFYDSTGLSRGFGVSEIPLRLDSDGSTSTTFAWTAPEGTRIVSCALFGCEPELTEGRIANFDQCVLFRSEFRNQVTGTFDLVEPDIVDLQNQSAPSCTLPAAQSTVRHGNSGVVITALLVGCWSYGEVGLTGASRLLAITPSQSPPYRDAVFRSCNQDGDEPTDGRSCHLSKNRRFGSCWQNTCARRCQSDADCRPVRDEANVPDAASDSDSPMAPEGGTDSATRPSCRCQFHFENLPYIGVCELEDGEAGICP
jgi:hypothetical protein